MLKIPCLKLIYLLSLVVLGALLMVSFFRPFATGKEYSTIQKEQLLKTKEGWIIQFDLVNQEKKDVHYKIKVMVDEDKPYEEYVLVRSGGVFTYLYLFMFYLLLRCPGFLSTRSTFCLLFTPAL